MQAHRGLLPDLFPEGDLRLEASDDEELGREGYLAPFALVRWGFPFRSVRY